MCFSRMIIASVRSNSTPIWLPSNFDAQYCSLTSPLCDAAKSDETKNGMSS